MTTVLIAMMTVFIWIATVFVWYVDRLQGDKVPEKWNEGWLPGNKLPGKRTKAIFEAEKHDWHLFVFGGIFGFEKKFCTISPPPNFIELLQPGLPLPLFWNKKRFILPLFWIALRQSVRSRGYCNILFIPVSQNRNSCPWKSIFIPMKQNFPARVIFFNKQGVSAYCCEWCVYVMSLF